VQRRGLVLLASLSALGLVAWRLVASGALGGRRSRGMTAPPDPGYLARMSTSRQDVLPAVEIEPDRPARHAVIWLHGLGADGHDFPPIVPELQLDPALAIRWVFPHAPSIPVTINGGMVMPAWYDINTLDLHQRHDEDGIRTSAERLTRLIERENERGVPTERVLLAGFSQGGAIALHTALRYPDRLAGVIGLSTYLVLRDELEAERSAANDGIPVFMAHGTLDPMVAHDRGQASCARLQELGYAVEWHEYPMMHQVCLEEIRDLGAWIAQHLDA
jgi:phospholipase/carboxylesterase